MVKFSVSTESSEIGLKGFHDIGLEVHTKECLIQDNVRTFNMVFDYDKADCLELRIEDDPENIVEISLRGKYDRLKETYYYMKAVDGDYIKAIYDGGSIAVGKYSNGLQFRIVGDIDKLLNGETRLLERKKWLQATRW